MITEIILCMTQSLLLMNCFHCVHNVIKTLPEKYIITTYDDMMKMHGPIKSAEIICLNLGSIKTFLPCHLNFLDICPPICVTPFSIYRCSDMGLHMLLLLHARSVYISSPACMHACCTLFLYHFILQHSSENFLRLFHWFQHVYNHTIFVQSSSSLAYL